MSDLSSPVVVAAIAVPNLPIYFLIFGIVSLALGVLGYLRAKSKASLISGGISGVLLIVSWGLMERGQAWGAYLALVVSALLTARFLPVFLVRKTFYPAGIMALLGIIGTVLGVLAVTGKA